MELFILGAVVLLIALALGAAYAENEDEYL